MHSGDHVRAAVRMDAPIPAAGGGTEDRRGVAAEAESAVVAADEDRGGGRNTHVVTKVGLSYATEAISYPSHPIDFRFFSPPLRFQTFFWIEKLNKGGGGRIEEEWGARLAEQNVIWDTGGYWDLEILRPNILDKILPKWERMTNVFRTVFREDESYPFMDENEMQKSGQISNRCIHFTVFHISKLLCIFKTSTKLEMYRLIEALSELQ